MQRNAHTLNLVNAMTEEKSYSNAPRSARDDFTARITSWLSGIEPLAPSSDSDMVFRTLRSKNHHAKPYSRPEGQRLPSHGSASTDEVPVKNLLDTRQNILDLRIAARIDRSMRTLPHPLENPLVTRSYEDLQDEYARIVILYNTIEEQRQQGELRWQHRPSITTLQDITNLEKSCQRVINAAQYIVDFAYTFRIDINFAQIFLRYRSTPVFQNGAGGSAMRPPPPHIETEGNTIQIHCPQPIKSRPQQVLLDT